MLDPGLEDPGTGCVDDYDSVLAVICNGRDHFIWYWIREGCTVRSLAGIRIDKDETDFRVFCIAPEGWSVSSSAAEMPGSGHAYAAAASSRGISIAYVGYERTKPSTSSIGIIQYPPN